MGEAGEMVGPLCFAVQAALTVCFGGFRFDWVMPAFGLAVALLTAEWAAAVVTAVALAAILGRHWWDRRGRKAARELGAKSRARVDALLGTLRELGQPLPEGGR